MTANVVVKFNDQPIPDIDALYRLLSEEKVGKPAKLTVIRRWKNILDLEIVPREYKSA